MKSSPVQLWQSTIDKILVEVNEDFEDGGDRDLGETVELEVKESCEPAKDFWNNRSVPTSDAGLADRTFVVSLGIRTDVESSAKSPYKFEIVCSGVVTCMPERLHKLAPDEAARQYGLSMIYGAMREQLLLVTSRMVHGPRMLPTVSFMEISRVAEEQKRNEPAISLELERVRSGDSASSPH